MNMTDITIIIKAFERPGMLARCIASIRRFYPDILIHVADDSEKPSDIDLPGVTVYKMPYDSGISAGRNLLVKSVTTPYFLLCDDDFIFTKRTKLERLLHILETSALDIIGGAVLNRPDMTDFNFTGLIRRGKKGFFIHKGKFYKRRKDYIVCDIIPNFWLGRTATVSRFRWDDSMKTSAQHLDYFIQVLDKLKVGWTQRVSIDHDNRGSSAKYRFMRSRGPYFGQLFALKYGLMKQRPDGKVPPPPPNYNESNSDNKDVRTA